MKLGDQLVDLRCQAEQPVKIAFVRVVLAFGADLFDLLGEVVGIVGHAQSQRQFRFVTYARAIDVDTDAERAILEPVGLEFRFIKDLPQGSPYELIPLPGLRLEVASLFGFPVLFLGGLELPALLGVANELGILQPLDGRLDFADGLGLTHLIDQERGEIGFRARQVANEFEQADRLGDPQRPAVVLRIAS